MLDYVLYLALLLFSLLAILLNVFSLPGNWLMFVFALITGWISGWSAPGWIALAIVAVLLLVGEGVELVAGALGARKCGATRLGAFAALVGAMLGAIAGIWIPIPLIGSIIGAVIGAFVLTLSVELIREKEMKSSLWAAAGAAVGRVMGIVAKVTVGLIALGFLAITAWPR
jgi:uncharacterized protein YqgC (DUF456 family)